MIFMKIIKLVLKNSKDEKKPQKGCSFYRCLKCFCPVFPGWIHAL